MSLNRRIRPSRLPTPQPSCRMEQVDEQAATAENEPADQEAKETPWPESVADTIVDSVTALRRLAMKPISRIARRIVYGFIAVILALLILLLAVIGLVRLLDAYLPQEVWLVYAILGGIFTITGLLIWSRRPKGAAS